MTQDCISKEFHMDMNFELTVQLNLDLRDLFHHL